MNILLGLKEETRSELLRRQGALKAYLACIENYINPLQLIKNKELLDFYRCTVSCTCTNLELINKALEERGE